MLITLPETRSKRLTIDFQAQVVSFREGMQPDFMDKHVGYKVMHSIYTVRSQNEPFKSRKGQFNLTASYQPTQNTHTVLKKNRFRLAEKR